MKTDGSDLESDRRFISNLALYELTEDTYYDGLEDDLQPYKQIKEWSEQ